MARALTAYLLRSAIPPRAAMQAAIDALHFPLKLDADYVPFATAGYLPCALDGEDAGFDLRFNAPPTDLSSSLQAAIGARDTALSVKWSSDPREEGAALMFCAALAHAFGALVHDPTADMLLSSDQLTARAREAFA
jgi:hypothetical protein